MKTHYCLIPIILLAAMTTSPAQTYATDSLRHVAEKEAKVKNIRLGVKEEQVEASMPHSFVRFDYATLAKGSFKLSSLVAVDYSGEYSKSEMEAYALECEEEFLRNEMILDISNNTLFFIERSSGKFRTLELEKIGSYFYNKNCKTCQDLSYKIVFQDKDKLVLEAKGQDEKVIHFQYFLTTIN